MRINAYHHEIEVMAQRGGEVVTKEADGLTWYGLRFYTEPPIMHRPGDDDSGAITLWVPWTKKGGHDLKPLRKIANEILDMADEIDSQDETTDD